MSLSKGLMYFLKYTFLALLLWYVYYVAKIIFASLRQASAVGRLELERHHQEQRAVNGGTAAVVSVREPSSREEVASAAERSGVAFAGALAPGRSDSVALGDSQSEEDSLVEEIPQASDSIDMEQTIAKKKAGWWHRRESGAAPERKLLVEEEEHLGEESTCACIKTVVDSWGFVEIVSGVEGKAKRLPVESDGILLGRSKDCAIRVCDGFASSKHARVFGDRDGVYLQDLNSRNGTFLNDQRISDKVELREGDTFSVGDAVFRYSRY